MELKSIASTARLWVGRFRSVVWVIVLHIGPHNTGGWCIQSHRAQPIRVNDLTYFPVGRRWMCLAIFVDLRGREDVV